MSDTGQTARNVVTPRKIAWVLLLGGAAWFVTISPKTPLQFFDAANRDDAALGALSDQPSGQPPSAQAPLFETLTSICREKERIELSYDMTNDPARVQHKRSSILIGSYNASPQTREALMRNNPTYHSLVEQLERVRLDLDLEATRKSKADAPNPERETEEHMDLRMKRFQAEIDRMLLRQFQSKLFWRGR